jgi:acetyl-CoA C-acetyltransferase
VSGVRDVYIVAAVRTPIGRFGGELLPLSSSELGGIVIKEAVNRSNIDPQQIDEVILGNVYQAGAKANPARQAALLAGLPIEVPAMTINKQCGSGLRAISLGYQQILAGEAELIVAAGSESMSNVPHLLLDSRWGKKLGQMVVQDSLLYDGLVCSSEGYHMGMTAENLAEKYGISREEQDRFALNSQKKALSAIQEGRFDEEIVPVKIKTRKGEKVVRTDEHPRDTTLESLSNYLLLLN